MLVILYKKNPQGVLSYYTLDDRQPSLFSPHTLSVSWGRSPDAAPRKSYTFDSVEAKDAKIRELMKRKLREYQVLYSYFKDAGEKLRKGFGAASGAPDAPHEDKDLFHKTHRKKG